MSVNAELEAKLETTTPQKILTEFANSPDKNIRECVAYNCSLSEEILEKLANDEYPGVRQRVAANRNAPHRILQQLINDRNSEVRSSVAGNWNRPFSIVENLVFDQDSDVRASVSWNTNLPLKLLKQLANDQDQQVRQSAARNLKSTPEIKKIVFQNFAKSEQPSFERLTLFMSEYADDSVLAENCFSISWLERYAITQNSQTSKNTLKVLARDGNRIVRAAAQESLQFS